MNSSYGTQVNPKYTKAELLNCKKMQIFRQQESLKKDIENCDWFINHQLATPQQVAEFKAEKIILENKLISLK